MHFARLVKSLGCGFAFGMFGVEFKSLGDGCGSQGFGDVGVVLGF